MTGTSRALKRLGVAGLSAVLMTTGFAAFGTVAANAATVNQDATSVSITPHGDSATVNTCNPFTATVAPTPGPTDNYTVTVQLTQQAAVAPSSTTIGFCDVSGFSPSAGPNPETPTGPQPANACPDTAASISATSPSDATCQGVFTTADGSSQVTFGVMSDTPGNMTVLAYVDKNGNDAFDKNIDTANDSVTKTWNPDVANNIDCTPKQANNTAGTSHTFTCSVTTTGTSPTGATGQHVKFQITAGPDYSKTTIYNCTENVTGTNSQETGHYGQYTCTYNNNGVTGTDDILAWVDVNNDNVVDPTEPQESDITKTWVTPAPNGSTVTVTCSPNTTDAAGDACQDPLTDKTATFTAHVASGVNSTNPAVGVIVKWDITGTTNTGSKSSQSLSSDSCTTDASGNCSVTLTEAAPNEDETVTVRGTTTTSAGASPSDSATKTWHTPQPYEARKITVAPSTGASQPSGGSQDFTATVTDRFGNPVKGVCVGWTESGPGHFVSGSGTSGVCAFATEGTYQQTCVTSTSGQCIITVVSQTTEKGTETVTATIDQNNYDQASGNSECSEPAGQTFGNNNTSTTAPSNDAPGSTAGVCTASGTVTWGAQPPPPPPPTSNRTQISAVINCVSHHRHHVLKCKVHEVPKKAGLLVIFKRRHHHHHHHIGHDWTNANGVAILKLHHLHKGSVWRVFAHVKATSTTRGATTDTTRTTIK